MMMMACFFLHQHYLLVKSRAQIHFGCLAIFGFFFFWSLLWVCLRRFLCHFVYFLFFVFFSLCGIFIILVSYTNQISETFFSVIWCCTVPYFVSISPTVVYLNAKRETSRLRKKATLKKTN